MPTDQLSDKDIFNVARCLDSPEAVSEYLDQVCRDDSIRRERILNLIKANIGDSFLEEPAIPLADTVESRVPMKQEDQVIGNYKLLQEIGEGGMGTVFMAEQTQPVKRQVALKLIKPGMSSKQVIARFASERQALAMMDHPNIAKVFDAGTTDEGHPYFVMELVKGVPITRYCDEHQLTPRKRLKLFTSVCQAVQHAHQKGIIHRDLKPSNVLVAHYDSQPVVKVIDFGVAKATGGQLTENTLFTNFGQVVGTLEYMSPEQARFNQLDIDTRSDIYSLGVLLYELLTGMTPFDRERLKSVAFDEVMRIIREEEPPKPSTRVSTSAKPPSMTMNQCSTESGKLLSMLRGDLDWLIMKALAKERDRRYETASGLAADIGRYLDGEPIEARPPSTAYRFRKLVRRNKMAFASGAVVAIALLLGMLGTSWQARLNRQLVQRLRTASINEVTMATLAGDGRDEARAAMEFVHDAGGSEAQLAILKGLTELNEGRFDKAVEYANKALLATPPANESDRIGPLALLATASAWAGFFERSEKAMLELRLLADETRVERTEQLLTAYALALPYPEEALSLIDNAPGGKHSTVELLIRGQAFLINGIDQKDAGKIDKAITDFEYVEFLYGANQSVVAWKAYALAAAIELARHEDRHEDEYRYTAIGRDVARRAAGFEQNPFIDFNLYILYRAIGEDDLGYRAVERIAVYPGGWYWGVTNACLLRHDTATANMEFDRMMSEAEKDNEYYRIAKALLVPGGTDGKLTNRNLVKDVIDHPATIVRLQSLFALCLVSGASEIEQDADRAAGNGLPQAGSTGGVLSVSRCIEYLAGRKKEAELLEESEQHGYSAVMAHSTVAMMSLAGGDRRKARKHFESAVATQTVGSLGYEWARACLARMEDDRLWPHSISGQVSER